MAELMAGSQPKAAVEATASEESAAVEEVRALLGPEVDVVSLMRLLEPRAAVVSARVSTTQERSDSQRQNYVDDAHSRAIQGSSPAPQAPPPPPTAQSMTSAPAVELAVELPGGPVKAAVQLSHAGIRGLVNSAYGIAGERGVEAARKALGAALDRARVESREDALAGGTPVSHEAAAARRELLLNLERAPARFADAWHALETGAIPAAVALYQEHAMVAVLARLRAARAEAQREAERYGFDTGYLAADDAVQPPQERRRKDVPAENEAFASLKALYARLRKLHKECSRIVEKADAEEITKYFRALDVARSEPEHGTPEPGPAADFAEAHSVIGHYAQHGAREKQERQIAAFVGYMELRAAAARAHPVLHRIAERPLENERDLERDVAVQLWRVHQATRQLEADLVAPGGRRAVWKHSAVFAEACAEAGLFEGEPGYRAAHDRLQKGYRSFAGDLLGLSAIEDAAVRGLLLGLAGLLLGGLTMGTAWAPLLNAVFTADSMLSSIVTHKESLASFTSALDTAKALTAEAPSEVALVVSLVFDLAFAVE